MVRFKIHASQIGKIMAEPKSKSETLSVGCKTFVKQWMKEQIYGRRRTFKSKYTDKGNACEDDAIKYVGELYEWKGVVKNTKTYENDWIIGTPDVIIGKNFVQDIKNSWSEETFPLFETAIPDKDYEWQLQGYSDLVGAERLRLTYCLMDATEALIDKEAYYKSKELGLDEVDVELYEEVKASMTFSHLGYALRIKSFDFTKDVDKINAIHVKVDQINDWIKNETKFYELIK